jgi:hypothetical protein
MSEILSYRGRTVTTEDVEFIGNLIAGNPEDCRTELSRKLCRAWNWMQPNGELKAMVCRGLLLQLDIRGHIALPASRPTPFNNALRRKRPESVCVDTTRINATVKELRPHLRLEQVRRTAGEKLFNSLIEHYHYLAYAQPVGEHLKYIIFLGERPIWIFDISRTIFCDRS